MQPWHSEPPPAFRSIESAKLARMISAPQPWLAEKSMEPKAVAASRPEVVRKAASTSTVGRLEETSWVIGAVATSRRDCWMCSGVHW